MLDGYRSNRGPTPNRLEDQLLQKRAERLEGARKRDIDLVYVYDYDHLQQTVAVVLANDRLALPIAGVPIAGAGGRGMRYIRPWKGLKSGTTEPDVGFIVYPRLGGGRALLDYVRRDLRYTYSHIQDTAIFIGGIPISLEASIATLAAGTPAAHEIGPDTTALVDEAGAGIIVNRTAAGLRQVILRGDQIYLLGIGQTTANAQAVARQGDAGDGMGGTIAGGSSRIFAG